MADDQEKKKDEVVRLLSDVESQPNALKRSDRISPDLPVSPGMS